MTDDEQAQDFASPLTQSAILTDAPALLQQANRNPDQFWADHAKTLTWQEPWKTVSEITLPDHQWFVGGRINACENALDRHVHAGDGDNAALTWLGEDGAERTFTYRQALTEVIKIAAMLRKLGVCKGDRVILYMPLTPEGIFSMLACARIGAVHVMVYAGMGAGALRDRIEDCAPSAILYADRTFRGGSTIALWPMVVEALAEIPKAERPPVVGWQRDGGAPPNGVLDWSKLSAEVEGVHVDPDSTGSEDPLFILYTSGTTGKPKGIVHVHGGYSVGVDWFARNFFEIGPGKGVWWSLSDIGWVVGHSYMAYGPFLAGGHQLIREGAPDYPDIGILWRLVDKYKVSGMFMAPTLLRMFMRAGPESVEGTSRRSLRLIGFAGETLNAEAMRWTYDHILADAPGDDPFGHVLDNFWQTEIASPLIATLPIMAARPGSAGLPMPTVEARIVAEDGNEVATGETGSLVIARPLPYMMRTIWNDHERYASLWSEDLGGYVSGDLAMSHPDGYISLLGRADDVLNIAGHRIGTAEVESCLIEHSAVAECAAIGLPDELKGAAIKVFLVLRDGREPGDSLRSALVAHVRDELGPIATPKEIAFVDKLPKTRSGKILRRLLKSRELGQPDGDLTTLDTPPENGDDSKDRATEIHVEFKALLLDQPEGADKPKAAIKTINTDQLPAGDVLVRVSHSSLNYKDGMVLEGVGGLVRNYPHVPGIDFAGTVEQSEDPRYKPGDPVVLTGWRVGEHHWGGFSEFARVSADWLVPLPDGLTATRAMALGTAGLTAMLCTMALEDQGLTPDVDLPILVTGGAGGVGSVAISLLAELGYKVAASTGRAELSDYLVGLGASRVVDRAELSGGPRRVLDKERWGSAIDTVGGSTLATLLSQMAYGGSVASCGLAGGSELTTNVVPFLLRAVRIVGVDSVVCPFERRSVAWQRLAAELPMEKLDSVTQIYPLSDVGELAKKILAGGVQGRTVIEI